MPTKTQLADDLFRIGAIRFGEFKLKHHEKDPTAPLSPIFLNLRAEVAKNPGPINNDLLERLSRAMADVLVAHQATDFDLIAGVPHAGDPYAEWLATLFARNGHPLGVLRLDKKESDAGRSVSGIREGAYGRGQRVLLVDDLITKADSKLEAIATLEAAGLVVKDVIVVVDRAQRGKEELEAHGCKLHCLFELPYLLAVLHGQKHIDRNTLDAVLNYIGWRP
jgi:orotate phosphoribosyltransferase